MGVVYDEQRQLGMASERYVDEDFERGDSHFFGVFGDGRKFVVGYWAQGRWYDYLGTNPIVKRFGSLDKQARRSHLW